MNPKPRIAVIGAGAFGGWTALHLLERGARVTLLDSWGPGNSRASSGGETRVMRGTYGPDQPYTDMAARALKLWTKYERRWKRQFLHRTGVLWMASGQDDAFESGSVKALRMAKIKFQELSSAQMAKRWPQINFEGIEWGIFEPDCGYLDARASCQAVVEAFVAAGGKFQQAAVLADDMETGRLRGRAALQGHVNRVRSARALAPVVVTTSGDCNSPEPLQADIYVFACGPWLGMLFPLTPSAISSNPPSRIFSSSARPPEIIALDDAHLPVWGDHRGRFRYGIPGSDRRGSQDRRRHPRPRLRSHCGDGERIVNPETLKDIYPREYIAFRFPALKNAPLVETRVCQYEQTPDSNFILDRHPKNENVWIVGGGSGHGFKHGPALGEMVAELILKDREPNAIWKLGRFNR